MASHSHMNRVDYAYFTKRPPLNEAAKRLDKLSLWEPKVFCYAKYCMFSSIEDGVLKPCVNFISSSYFNWH